MPNRTLCTVLDEMRQCVKTLNFAYLLSLIEEVQTLGNRMEASLWDQNDIDGLHTKKRELKQEVKDLKEERNKLRDETKKCQSKG